MASHWREALESEVRGNVTTASSGNQLHMRHHPTASSGARIKTTPSTTTSDSMGRIKTNASLVAPTHVEASLLHCIRSDTLLHRGAEAFKSQECDAKNYQKSFETTYINDFISHDWASHRWSKMLALCLVYNGKAALIAEFVVCIVMFFLQLGDEPFLPFVRPSIEEQQKLDFSSTLDNRIDQARLYGCWCTIASTWVFILFFFFWQDIRYKLGLTTRRCFLDKYCIDQTNPERKSAGILGLAGFLRASDRIVILWTPRYFTRLWCTYELASWLHLEKQLSSVSFMPLSLATIVLTAHTACCLAFHCLVLSSRLFPFLYLHLLSSQSIVFFTLVVHLARHNVASMRAIPEQLANFSVTSSQCYCCSVDHNEGGEEISCDREVVYSTIASWFGCAEGEEMAALERFDRAIRIRFAMKVLQKAGPTQMSWFYSWFCGHFFLIRGFDLLSAAHQIGHAWFIETVFRYIGQTFTADVFIQATLHVCVFSDKWVGIPRSRVLDLLWSCCVSGATMGLMFPVVYLSQEAGFFIKEKYLLQAFLMLFYLALSVWCHFEEVDDWLRTHSRWYRKRRPGPLANLPSQNVTDAIPFDMMDEGQVLPPPFLKKLRAVRIVQDPDSDGSASQVEPLSPLSPKSATSPTSPRSPTAPYSARSKNSMSEGVVPLPPRFTERLWGARIVKSPDSDGEEQDITSDRSI